MKVDKFTKVLLTIIAVNLSILTFKNLDVIPKAYANDPVNDYAITPQSNYGLVPLNEDGTITVKLDASGEMNVNIVGIDTYDELDVNIDEISTNDELNVNIDEIGGGSVSYGGPIKVKTE